MGRRPLTTPEREARDLERVMARTGRPLRDSEIAIHRDGDRRNVSPANLEIITRAEMLRRRLNRHRDPITGRAA